MATYEELKKRAKQQYEEEEKKKKQSEEKSSNSGTSSYAALKERAKMESIEEEAQKIDSSRIQLFIDTANDFFSSAEEEYGKVGWGNASTTYQSRLASFEDLELRKGAIHSWLLSNRGNIDKKTYDELSNYIDTFNSKASSVLELFKGAKDYYAQWDTEGAYNFWRDHGTYENRTEWYSDQQSRLAKLKADRDAENARWSEVDPIELGVESMEYQTAAYEHTKKLKAIDDEINAVETEMRNYERGNLDEEGRYYGSKVVDDYQKYAQAPDFDTASANRDFGNATKEDFDKWYYQTYGGVMIDPETGKEIEGSRVNPGVADTSKESLTINDPLGFYLQAKEYRDSVDARYQSLGVASREYDKVMTDASTGAWDQLTATEIGIYYVLMNEQGYDSAMKFLSDMEVELTKRATMAANQNTIEAYDEANLLGKVMLNAASVATNVLSAPWVTLEHAVSTVKGEEINPYSVTHAGMHFSNTVRSETAADFNEKNGGRIPILTDLTGFTKGDAYQAGMSILDSYAAIGIGGKFGGLLLASSAANSEATRLYEQGASMEQIALGSAAAGAAEMIFESLSIEKLITMKDATTVGQLVKNALIQAGVEASEEAFTEIANIITNSIIMGNQSDWAKLVEQYGGGLEGMQQAFLDKVRDVANASIAGFLSGAGSAGGSSTVSYGANRIQQRSQYTNAGKAIMQQDGGVDALMALANEVAGVSDKGTQKNLQKQMGNVTKNATSRQVGKLYQAVANATNTADFASDLKRSDTSHEHTSETYGAKPQSYIGEQTDSEQTTPEQTTPEQTATKQRTRDKKGMLSAVKSAIKEKKHEKFLREHPGWEQEMDEFVKFLEDDADVDIDQASPAIFESDDFSAFDMDDAPAQSGVQSISEAGTGDVNVNSKASAIDGEGNSINIKGIASIQKGKMVLETDTGTIDSSEVTLDSDDLGLIYEAVASLGDRIDATAANKLIQRYNGGNAMVYGRGMAQAYTYGFYGLDTSELMGKNSLATELTKEQRNYAYNLGHQYRNVKDQADKVKARAFSVVQAAGKKGVYYRSKDGTVTDFRSYEKDSGVALKDVQKTAIDVMERMSKIMGVRFNVFESWVENGKRYYLDENGVKTEGNPNGFYDPKTGEIYIDLAAGNDYQGTMLFTVAHELTHFMRQWSPEHFTKIARIVFKHGGMKGHVSELVAAKQAKAKAMGRHLSYDTAMEEAVADGMETILKDGKVVEFMADVKKTDHAAWEKIKEWFKNLSEFLKELVDAYSGHSAQTAEGERVAAFAEDLLHQIEQIWAEGAVAAGENYQASLTPGEEGVVANENGDPVAYSSEDGSVLLSMRTYDEEGRKAFRAYLQKCVDSKKLTKAEMQEMLDGIEDIYMTCKEFKDKYAPFSSWSDAAVVRDTYGKPVFSVVTPNGDYKMNLDFSLVCKKRRTLDAVFNEMSKRGIIDNFELGQKSVVKVNEIIRKYGLETACALCFVDAKRFRQASMADSFTRLYNELVLSLVPEDHRTSIDHFNFAGYETIKMVEDGIHTWDKSKLDFSHLDEVMNNYGEGTVEYKAAKYIKSHAEGRRLLLRGDFMSSQGFDAVKTQNPDVLKLYNSKKGTGGPKAAFGDVQYMNEIIKKARAWTPEKAYAVGGVRIQSFSDYVPRMVFDYVQMIYDLAATKLPAHAYTKEALFVKQFGLTGVKINMSLIPAIAEGGVAPGLDANGNYVWAGESFDFETAKEIQNAEGYSENCGTICVGVSDRHIRKLLSDPDIRMVIPYHKSGLNPIVAHMNKIAEFTDYTKKQNTTVKETGAVAPKHFDFNKALHDMGANADPKTVIQQYFDWCDDNGYDPKFADFRDHPNYYKLIEDFTLYDKDEKYVPQREVRAVFPNESSAFGSMKKLIVSGLKEDAIVEGKRDSRLSAIVDEIQNTLPRTEAEISEEQVEQADRDLEAEAKYSDREYSYDSLVSKPDMTVTEVGGDIPKNRADIVAQAKKNAASVGRFDPKTGSISVHVKDIGKDIVIGTTGLKHGLEARRTENALVTLKAGEVLQNSIRINELTPKKENADGSYVLIGAARGDSGDLYIVRSVVNTFKHELMSMDVLYAINAKKGNRLRSMRPGFQGPVTDSTISIAELLDHVNQYFPDILPEEVLKYYGYDARPEGKLGEDALYSDRTDDSVSNRSLLANAFEGVAQNDIERQRLQEYRSKVDLINAEERKLRDLNQQIKDLSFAKGPKDTKAIRDLQFEARQTANRINTYDKMLLRLEASQPLQNVLAREKKKAYQRAEKKGKEALEAYREKTMKTQRELLEKWQESRKKGIEGRHRTAMRHKIKDVVNELNQYLLRGTKDRHVPIELQKAVAEALDAVNMDTVGAEERIAKLQDELLKAKTPEQIQEISRKIDHVREMGDKMNGRLQKLKDGYDKFLKDPDLKKFHDEVISNKLESVIGKLGNTPLRDMTLAQLEDVHDMYRMVLTTIRNANKAFKAKKSESISTIANRVMEEVDKVGSKKKFAIKGVGGIKSFAWNNLKPVYAFEHIGSDTFTEVFNAVRSGEDIWAVDVTDAREFYLDKSKKHGYDSWDFKKRHKFTSSSGMDFELNLEQIMSLYAYSKRDQAADHLKYGGIVFDDSVTVREEIKVGPIKMDAEVEMTDATAYNISEATLAEIISKLSKEQKAFVDEMQDYLSTVMGAKGNEVSLEMYGIKLFKDKFYFPLKSSQVFMERAREQQKGEVKIKNSGFSKETVPHATNPIVLTPFMNVWADHVNEMSMYHAFVLPMEDFYRVYNYKTPSNNEALATEGVFQYIQNAYGKGATKYIDQLLKDLNGGARNDPRADIPNKLVGLFKKGAVFASLSVVVQQPSAIARAAALVDTKYFIGPKVDHKRHAALWDEVKQYAPVAVIKEMGYFDTNMGKSTQDFILGKEYSGFSQKMKALFTDSGYRDEALSKAPALADEIAWCSIWEAVKRETKANYPGLDTKGVPFLKLAGSRFTEVIVKTQVYDSVLSRSGLMRSKDGLVKMGTSFMAEPTTSINMVADALLKGKRGNWKYASGAIGAVIASQILNSILVSFVYAGRDDDEDETYWEKYIGTLTGEVLDSLNPAGYIPFIKDIQSIVKGYDVERSDMAVISDLWNAYQNLSKDTVSVYRKVEGFAGSIAQIFGLPVKNIMRDVRGIYQTVMSFVNGQQTTAAGIGYAVKSAAPKWLGGGDVSNQNQLYEAYLSGDKTQIARVRGRFKDQNAINTAIRSALRENDPRIREAAIAWNANNLDEYMRLAREIIAEKHFVQDDVVMAIRAEASALEPDDGTTSTSKAKGLFTTEKFVAAIAQGDEATANAAKMDIIQTSMVNGKSEEDAEKSFVSSVKTEMKKQFLAGAITENQAIDTLIDFCGETEEDAMWQIKVYDWQKEGFDIDKSGVENYETFCEPAGIDKQTYFNAYLFYEDSGEEGVAYSKTIECMPYIDSLPLTSYQKTALAKCWWAESTVNKYKTW